MAYGERRRQVADTDYERIYDKVGNGTSVVLLDGMAAGVWEFGQLSDTPGAPITFRVAPFGDALTARWLEVESAAARVAESIGAGTVTVECTPAAGRLADGARNA